MLKSVHTAAAAALALLVSIAAPTGNAAAAVTQVHYQKTFALTCNGGAYCLVTVPALAAKRRLIIEKINCLVVASPASEAIPGEMQVRTSGNVTLFRQFVTPRFSNAEGNHAYDQDADVIIDATQHALLAVGVTPGAISTALCSLTGTLQVFP